MKKYILSIMFFGALTSVYAQDPQLSSPTVSPAPAVNGGPITATLNFQNASSLPINNPDPVNNMTVISISLNKMKPTLDGDGSPVVTGAGAAYFTWVAECSGTCAPDGSSDATDVWSVSGFQNQVIPGQPDPFTTIGGPIQIAGIVTAPSTPAQANANNGSGYIANITPGAGGDIDLSPASNSVSTYTNTVVPPVATADVPTTAHDTNITIDVLANDTPGDAPIAPGTVKLIDPVSGNPVTTVTVPGEGVYTVNANGTITFDPEPGFSGLATPIKYTVSDTNGQTSSPANITVDVGVLPVTLIRFNAAKEGKTVQLSWATTEETNSDRFEVEHSLSGKVWSRIGTVTSHGESNSLKTYSFPDAQPANGDNLYRLKMIDKDDTYAYSRIQNVKFSGLSEADLSIYPNPATDKVIVRDFAAVKEVVLTDLSGRVMLKTNSLSNGEISLKNFSEGLYIVKITRLDGSISSQKVVINK
ncbi:T9SS type A sorting domain-containing protein [Dyadobacter diqingensis]|uniref:T9SS type A sorting domain-containing protein n=1 Tax=Dyadobacter diqingensis TaxID=2938121 RepID=UPI0020C194BD|nr:T9SS type A sorting domain-containing protein [Dyadobacter diqingensis]